MKNEIGLIDYSYTLIRRCELNIESVRHNNPLIFRSDFLEKREGMMMELYKLTDEKLATILRWSLAPGKVSFYRQTSTSQMCPSGYIEIKWNGKNAPDLLIHLAKYVAMACMYDILRAAHWVYLKDVEQVHPSNISFLPQRPMIMFVTTHGLQTLYYSQK